MTHITDNESFATFLYFVLNIAIEILSMGQSTSACKDFLPDTVDAVQFQFTKHSKILNELNNLTFEQFQESLQELNEL